MTQKRFAILGGDQRQLYLGELLERDGHQVNTWGLGNTESVDDALSLAAQAHCVVLPLPVTRDNRQLSTPLSAQMLPLELLWPVLRPERQLVCGGMVPQEICTAHHVLDYYCREEVQIANAALTAEGAVAAAVSATVQALHCSRCLVLGYGRIGKILAHRLRGLGASVAVSARKLADLAWIRAFDCLPLSLSALEDRLSDFDVIFNTVPAPLLTASRLKKLKAGCVILELASAPGGIDSAAAKNLGIPLIPAPGLPGKTAPLAAAAVLQDGIYHLLDERGELH